MSVKTINSALEKHSYESLTMVEFLDVEDDVGGVDTFLYCGFIGRHVKYSKLVYYVLSVSNLNAVNLIYAETGFIPDRIITPKFWKVVYEDMIDDRG